MVTETTWAYFAGMLDGEGHLALFRHYRKKGNVSARGYEIDPRLTLSNMNLNNLEVIQQQLQLGKIQILRKKKKESNNYIITYELRFNCAAQRIILPKIIPYLIQKKIRAELILKLLLFRQKGSMNTRKNQIIKPLIEQYYLELEQQFEQAKTIEKPWSLTSPTHKGRKSAYPQCILEKNL